MTLNVLPVSRPARVLPKGDCMSTPKIPLKIDPKVQQLLEERGIREENLQQVITTVEEQNLYHQDSVSGHRLAYLILPKVTYWVEYQPAGDGYTVLTAYSHRMEILEGFNLPPKGEPETFTWKCIPCDRFLEMATVKLAYMEETFGVDLPACPSCQRVFISEQNAVEKMALAEKMLEDK